MKKDVTYLLGAGASANAIPAVKNFTIRLGLFLYHLERIKGYQNVTKFIDEVRKG